LSILSFPAGLPGFDHRTHFTLVEAPGLAPIVFLQSLDDGDLGFLAAPVSAIAPDYALSLTPEDRQHLGPDSTASPELLCLALLCAPENGPLTANLLAPVVINLATRSAVQSVRADSLYSHQHRIPAEPLCS
jgi:flagellar assembly factor FliW